MALHLPRRNFICHYLGWSFSLVRSSWRLHHLPSYSLPITLYLYFVFDLPAHLILHFSVLTSLSCSHLCLFLVFTAPKAHNILQISSLDPSSYTFVVCSLHHPEKPYSFFFCTFYFVTWLKSRQTELYQTSSVWRETVPAARERERERTGCFCQANEVIFRNFQKYSWCHFYFLKVIENKVVGFVNRKKRIY